MIQKQKEIEPVRGKVNRQVPPVVIFRQMAPFLQPKKEHNRVESHKLVL